MLSPSDGNATQAGEPESSAQAGAQSDAGAKPTDGCAAAWPALSRIDRCLVVGTLLLVASLTVPRLPSGVCWGDSGELQLVSETLGIAHPPGYGIYATIGFALTRLPFVEPSYLVSLACLGSGLAALALCILLQVRVGVCPALACALSLVLAAHTQIWSNLIVPEVYMPSLALMLGSAYLLVRYARLQRARDLMWAMVCLGLLIGSRPPAVLLLPFWLIATVPLIRRAAASRHGSGKTALCALLCVAAPIIYAPLYLWLRDTSATPYNYIDQYNAEFGVLPSSDAGPIAGVERVWWHITARQYQSELERSWAGAWTKLTRWLPSQIGTNRIFQPIAVQVVGLTGLPLTTLYPLCLAGTFAVCLLGLARLARRCMTAFCVLVGIGGANLVFIGVYRSYGDAANIFPLLAMVTVLTGAALSPLIVPAGRKSSSLVGIVLLVAAGVFMLVDAPRRPEFGAQADAQPFLDELDLASLPENSIICTSWSHAPPLWYVLRTAVDRADILVLNAQEHHWPELLSGAGGRPVYATSASSNWGGKNPVKYRNIWCLRPPTTDRE